LGPKMPGKQQQLRVDPADGKAYPLDSFLDFYGQDEGQRRWQAAFSTAGKQPAPGICRSPCPVYKCLLVCFCLPSCLPSTRSLSACLVSRGSYFLYTIYRSADQDTTTVKKALY
jgi:hypothetical protein